MVDDRTCRCENMKNANEQQNVIENAFCCNQTFIKSMQNDKITVQLFLHQLTVAKIIF